MVREVLDVVLELAKSGQTMLIVTHEMQFARAIADHIILLDGGRIVEESYDAQAFFEHPQTERAAAVPAHLRIRVIRLCHIERI